MGEISNEESKTYNNISNYLLEQSKYFHKLNTDENFLFSELNGLPKDVISHLKDRYSIEDVIGEPSNLLRSIILKELDANKVIAADFISILGDAITNKSIEFLQQFVPQIKEPKHINKSNSRSPLQNWNSNFKLFYTFFLASVETELKSNSDLIATQIITIVESISKYKYTYIFKDYNGPRNQGQGFCSILIFSNQFNNNKYCGHLCIDFKESGVFIKPFIGVNVLNKSELDNKYQILNREIKILNYEDLVEAIKKQLPLIESINNELELENNKSYWIFQGNPKHYDFDIAFAKKDIDSWSVTAHKDKIKAGDKAIIWITGENAGCYAFADILSEPKEREINQENDHWKIDKKSEFRVDIKISKYINEAPIRKEQLANLIEFQSFNVGNQGTNFTATKNQYNTLLILAQKMSEPNYWLIASGQNARLWDDFYNSGIVAIGWDELGDLSKFASQDEIKAKLQEIQNTDRDFINDGKANYEFAKEMKIGDIVVAKNGKREIIGYSKIISDYHFDDARAEYKSIRKVEWLAKGNWIVSSDLPIKTLTKISEQNYEEYMKSINESQVKLPEQPLNVILYGPPGTGKTYNTKRKALEIILGRQVQDEEIKELFEQHKEQIVFTTFHQSYAYEQFIEGIAVETNETGNAIYRVKDGVFKNACNLAVTLTVRKNDLFDEANDENSITIYEYLIDPLFKSNSERINEDGTIEPSDFDNAPPVVLIIDEINRGNISKIFGELITLIEDDKRLGEENELIVTLPYSQKAFGVPPNLYIIGTMNTADRSLVQLDTALRRRFEFEEMMPKYHQTDMFKGSLKNEELLNWENEGKIDHYEISYFLKKLNDKICQGYDRDHQIGHSFLMKVEDIKQLQRAWENKIMPLLQEYFYSDYEKLSEVIGEKSDYLKKDRGDWILNMKVNDFASQFKLVYDSVCPEVKTTNIQEDNHLPTVS